MPDIPILGREDVELKGKAIAYADMMHANYAYHNDIRRTVVDSIKEQLAKPEPPGLYIAMKELELAIHSQAMGAAIAQFAILAALGIPVPTPMQAVVDAEAEAEGGPIQ